ncbi:MAG: DUF2203 domain-containing protein [Acidobacteriota bacterium]|nr:DUF2203 domain-containing protein [Blastocatellia bacterium]MDW8412595.1 DUF2203 domain-containing protein [Acidobacteriota bacterium]
MKSGHQVKIFSLEQANNLLPLLRPLMRKLLKSYRSMLELEPHIQPARQKNLMDGGSVFGVAYIKLAEEFVATYSKIDEMGVLVKDLRIGLCDFPHIRDGRLVYLCWKVDEEKIGYWHEVDSGFAGRQPL